MNGNQIKDITPQGITYLDNSGEEHFIDFSLCYETYVKRNTTPEYWERHKHGNNFSDADWLRHLERVKNWKEVGARNIGAKEVSGSSYIVFYTEPPVRFSFASQDEFYKVQNALRRARWKTFDLT